MLKKIKIGLIGLGNIGKTHADILTNLENVELVAVCDVLEDRANDYAKRYHSTAYTSYLELLDRSGAEAVIIAVPHFDHPQISVEAFKRGIHVLLEKPIAVHVKDARETIEAYQAAKTKYPNLMFGMMLQERTLPYFLKVKEILDSKQLGRLTRVTWINTQWFRTQTYYDSGGWRATWAGEGGGILTNQCPHNLDFYQWVFGLPSKIMGHANLGKYHDIEVEDEVTAYFEHENGMVGHFIVTTAESPGTNRLEIVGENGKLILEERGLYLYKNDTSMLTFCKESKEGFANVNYSVSEVNIDFSQPAGHKVVIEAFVDKLLHGTSELIADGEEGIRSLQLANGIMLSAFTGQTIELPVNEEAYLKILNEKIKYSKYDPSIVNTTILDVSTSFTK